MDKSPPKMTLHEEQAWDFICSEHAPMTKDLSYREAEEPVDIMVLGISQFIAYLVESAPEFNNEVLDEVRCANSDERNVCFNSAKWQFERDMLRLVACQKRRLSAELRCVELEGKLKKQTEARKEFEAMLHDVITERNSLIESLGETK